MTTDRPTPPGSVHHVARRRRSTALDTLFAPKSVAVIGATEKEGSVGRAVLENFRAFTGTVFPVNPKRATVLGRTAFASVSALPEVPDLVVIVTPAASVPGLIRECVAKGVPSAIIIPAGFKEIDPAGTAMEQEILAEARRGGLRIIGPNCLGVMSPALGFNATFAASIARPGNVAFISQSGALCTAILDWSFRENLRAIYETPAMEESADVQAQHSSVSALIAKVRESGRTILTEFESKQLLVAAGIPTAVTHIARTEDEAVLLAEKLGFPIVLKLHSETITHKTDVGGVQLSIRTPGGVRHAWQSIERSCRMAQPSCKPRGWPASRLW